MLGAPLGRTCAPARRSSVLGRCRSRSLAHLGARPAFYISDPHLPREHPHPGALEPCRRGQPSARPIPAPR
eukprot:6661036-Alexandrium_andersonii.AAC.1